MSISSNIYHFLLARTFKILSPSFFKVLALTTAHQNLFLPTCKMAPTDYPFPMPPKVLQPPLFKIPHRPEMMTQGLNFCLWFISFNIATGGSSGIITKNKISSFLKAEGYQLCAHTTVYQLISGWTHQLFLSLL